MSLTEEDLTPTRIQEVMAEGDGCWVTCSGCHESEDGYDVGRYPFSKTFGCKLGGGCGECGGLGAVWDTTDYAAMGDWLTAREQSRQPQEGAGQGEAVAWTNERQLMRLRLSPKERAAMWGLQNGTINIPLYTTPPALQARVEALETELISAARFMDIARRAIESGQVVDKDVHGTLCRARDRARAALTGEKG